MTDQTEDRLLLRLSGVSKDFGLTKALREVSLTIRPGEVHGLLGENGSGKSTLIKVLAGFYVPDRVEQFSVRGKEYSFPLTAADVTEIDISFVHQDLGLVPTLTVAENLVVPTSRRRFHVSWRNERKRLRTLLASYHVDVDPAQKVSDLTGVQRAMVAIVRAIEKTRRVDTVDERKASILVLDEPTVFLPRREAAQLFQFMANLRAEGAGILFISHDLDEVLEVTDRVTVLRDGALSGTGKTADLTRDQLVEMIVGGSMSAFEGRDRRTKSGSPHVVVRELQTDRIDALDLEVGEGEVLGVTGLVGSGFEDLAYALSGARPAERGQLVLDGQSHDLARAHVQKLIDHGVVLVPGDRLREGCVGTLTVNDNLALPVLAGHTRHGRLDRRSLKARAQRLMDEYHARPNRPSLHFGVLSGGNQQKVLMAKWLQTEPRFLLLHEPTQGVDIGARQEILAVVDEVTSRGCAAICCSSDYEQLASICDRVLILGRGRVVSELVGPMITKERISEQCLNSLSR